MKQKGFAPIIILILIALAVVGYFGYKNYWPKIQSSTTPTQTATADPTANWKTYENDQYGFSFSYPKELTYLYDQLNGGNLLLQNFDGLISRNEQPPDFQLALYIEKNVAPKPLEDYPRNWEKDLGKLQTETITINGIKAIKGFSGQKYQAVPTVWFVVNKTLYTIQLSNPNSTNKDWFDEIISTFKFSN